MTRSGGSTPSCATTRWPGTAAWSFACKEGSTPTSRILAIPHPTITPPAGAGRGQAPRLGAREPDPGERLVERDTQPPVAVEEEQQPEDDERRARRNLDGAVVPPHPAEGAHRVREGDAGGDEGGAEPEGVSEQQDDAAQNVPARAREHE